MSIEPAKIDEITIRCTIMVIEDLLRMPDNQAARAMARIHAETLRGYIPVKAQFTPEALAHTEKVLGVKIDPESVTFRAAGVSNPPVESHGQTIRVGSQVAYVYGFGHRVSTVERINYPSLLMSNGNWVHFAKVVVTDGYYA